MSISNKQDGKKDKKIKKKKVYLFKLILFFVFLFIPTFSTFAFFAFPSIVYDPTLDKTLKFLLGKQIFEEIKQYEQMISSQLYLEEINGQWQDSLDVIKLIRTKVALTRRRIEELGWKIDDIENRYKDKDVIRIIAAVEDIKKIADGQVKDSSDLNLRDNLELIYGIAPATIEGVKVDAAYRQIAQTTAKSGETQKSIKELEEEIAEIRAELSEEGLVPGDRDRLLVLLEADKAYLETLKIQLTNEGNLLSSHQLGISASQEVKAENGRLETRYSLLTFTPKLSPETGNDRPSEE